MDPVKSKYIEALVLSDPNWKEGSVSGHNLIGQARSASTLNLSVQAASVEGRDEALRILRDKYHVGATLVNSASFDKAAPQGTAVLRVADNGPFRDIEKLDAVRQLASANCWMANKVTENGKKQVAQNLRADRLTDMQIEHIRWVLKDLGVSNTVTVSHSLAKGKPEGVRFIRVVGEDDIAKLAGAIPTLEQLHVPSAPEHKAGPHRGPSLRT